MPPRKRTKADESEQADICEDCWPAGWPDGSSGACCIHGQWTRTDPNADPNAEQ